MKKINIIITLIITCIFAACSGSDKYRGTWKAMDLENIKYDITFSENTILIKDTLGQSNKYEYSQNSINVTNNVTTYGILLKDGRRFQIHFPNSKDENTALIKDENGNPVYTISRKQFMKYDDYYKFN